MKHYLFVFLLLFIVKTSSFAQNTETRFQQVESAKIAYITKNLELTPTEAQKFFPIYNEYRKEMREISHQKKADRNNLKSESGLEFDSKVLACKKKYHARFTTIISPTKASRFFEVEREFREQLFKELENRNRKRN